MANRERLSKARSNLINSLRKYGDNAGEDFVLALNKTANIATRENIETCSKFIREKVFEGSAHNELGEYLLLLSASFGVFQPDATRIDTTTPGEHNAGLGRNDKGELLQPPQPAFKRLHLVQIVADAISWTMIHRPGSQNITDGIKEADYDDVAEEIVCRDHFAPTYFPKLVIMAGCTGHKDAAKPHDELKAVLDSMHVSNISLIDFDSLHRTKSRTPQSLYNLAVMADEEKIWDFEEMRLWVNDEETNMERKMESKTSLTAAEKGKKQPPVLLPLCHGNPVNPYAEWHELPAANGLYMKRTHGYPLRARALPPGGYPIQGGGQYAPQHLQKKAEAIHAEVLAQFEQFPMAKHADEIKDIDALGNVIWKDPNRPTRNYYGFDVAKIELKKEIDREAKANAIGYENCPMYPLPDEDQVPPFQEDNSIEDAVSRAREMARGGFGGGRGGRGGRGGGF